MFSSGSSTTSNYRREPALRVLQAEPRVLRQRLVGALGFHVSHRWQQEGLRSGRTLWKCIWWHEIFISLPALWQYLFTRFVITLGSASEKSGKGLPPCELWFGGGGFRDKKLWSWKSWFIAGLTGHCIIRAAGRTWSMAPWRAQIIHPLSSCGRTKLLWGQSYLVSSVLQEGGHRSEFILTFTRWSFTRHYPFFSSLVSALNLKFP